MTRFVAAFTGLIFCITLSACSPDKTGIVASETMSRTETSNSEAIPPSPDVQIQVKPSTMAPVQATQRNDVKEITEAVVNQNAITITPEKDSNRIQITYPQYEINNNDKISVKKSYSLLLTPGDYSDPKNAVTTFLFDLYMKQSLCFDNIHANIDTDKKYQSFLRTIYLLESLNLNLGQIDVLALPRFEYYEDNVPYLFRSAAAFKTEKDDIINFGSTVEKDKDYKQVSRGSFDCSNATLSYEVTTQEKEAIDHKTYFEAVKTKDDDFIYRCMNIYEDNIACVFVIVSSDLMQAGYYEGKLSKDYKFKALQKTAKMPESDKENGLNQIFYLFANGDGAVITPVEEEQKIIQKAP